MLGYISIYARHVFIEPCEHIHEFSQEWSGILLLSI